MKNSRLLLIIILISALVLSTVLFQRIRLESKNKLVDLVLDYPEIREMALQSDQDLAWWFSNFKTLGVRYVGLHEENIESMIRDNKDLNLIMGWEALQKKDLGEEVLQGLDKDHDISKYDVLVTTKSRDIFDFIYNGLNSRYDNELFEILSRGDSYTILLKGNINDMVYERDQTFVDVYGKGVALDKNPYSSKLIKLGLGFDRDKVNLIKSTGLEIMSRPSNYNRWTTDKYIDGLFKDFEDLDIYPPVLIFTGNEILGYPNYSYLTREYMEKNHIKVGLVETAVQREHLEQDGLEELTRDLQYNAVRIFSVWPYIQERFKFYNYEGAEEIENTLYRAVTERNIRLIYFKPFKENKQAFVTDFKEYEKMFDRFQRRIASHGLSLGESSTMAPSRVRIAKQSLIGWGVVAAGLLLLSLLFNMTNRTRHILLALGLLTIPIIYVIRPFFSAKLVALAASIIFPSLSMAWVLDRSRTYIKEDGKGYSLLGTLIIGIKDLVIATAISLLGGFFIGGILSNTEFLLEMDIFRGVKLSQILPIILYVGIYMAYFGYKNKEALRDKASLRIEDIKTFLLEDIKLIYVLLGAILLVVGYIFIARTGHETNIQPSSFEIIVRNILEERLLARPRTTEFLIAFPALIVTIYFAKRGYRFLTFIGGLVSVLGQSSITNTFSHLRTPVYLSTLRTVYSLIIGIILGVIYVIIIENILRIGFKFFRTGVEKGRN